MSKRNESFPEWMTQAVENAIARGNELATFDSESECAAMRLKFYRFLANAREDSAHKLHEKASRITVQWLCAPSTKSKRMLRFVANGVTANPLAQTTPREDLEQELEKERLLAEYRAQFRQK